MPKKCYNCEAKHSNRLTNLCNKCRPKCCRCGKLYELRFHHGNWYCSGCTIFVKVCDVCDTHSHCKLYRGVSYCYTCYFKNKT